MWTGLIGYLLLSPEPEVGGTVYFEGQDKVAHFVLFMVWCSLIYMIRSRSGKLKTSLALIVLSLGIVLAVATEWLQGYMPTRSSDITDVWFDLSGAVSGIVLGYLGKKELIRAEKKFDK